MATAWLAPMWLTLRADVRRRWRTMLGLALRRIESDGLIEIVGNWGTFRKQAD